MSRLLLSACLLLLCLGWTVPPASTEPTATPITGSEADLDPTDKAVAYVENVGGEVVRDPTASGKPVVEVSFGAANKKVTDDGLKELAGLKSLKSLSLFFSGQITDAGMKHLKGLTGLEKLVIGNTSVTDAGVAELKDMKNLKSFTTSGCIRMTDKSAETINGFTNLEDLSLPSTIGVKGIKHLKDLKKLTTLYVGGAMLRDSAIEHIADTMPELESLNLGATSGNGLTDECVPHLARLKKLSKLNIIGTTLTDKGWESLLKALPDCTIER